VSKTASSVGVLHLFKEDLHHIKLLFNTTKLKFRKKVLQHYMVVTDNKITFATKIQSILFILLCLIRTSTFHTESSSTM